MFFIELSKELFRVISSLVEESLWIGAKDSVSKLVSKVASELTAVFKSEEVAFLSFREFNFSKHCLHELFLNGNSIHFSNSVLMS